MMADERVTTYETPAGTNTTTVIHEGPARSGNGAGWLFGIVLLIAVLAVVYLMAIRNDTQRVKDHAITNAAAEVGTAAKKVGTAAQDAADNLTQK